MLAAMLLACADLSYESMGSREGLEKLIQCATRLSRFSPSTSSISLTMSGRPRAELLLDAVRQTANMLSQLRASASTVHTSAVDDAGVGCAITASAGYGSGEMPAGTGLWLNNGLGEVELNRRAVSTRAPGSRLPSNMAPTVARSDEAVLAIGSPGADRITSAIHQVLVNLLQLGLPLEDAVRHPRLHVDMSGDTDVLKAENGLDLPERRNPAGAWEVVRRYVGVCGDGGQGVRLF